MPCMLPPLAPDFQFSMTHPIRHESPLTEPINLSFAEAVKPARGLLSGRAGTVNTAFRHRSTAQTARILQGGPK